MDKTVVTAIEYDELGRPRTPHIPPLFTHDGRRLPSMAFDKAYKHLGVMRRLDCKCSTGDAKLWASWRGYMAQLRQFKELRSGEFIEASNIITRGLGGSWGAAAYLPFRICERMEASWRQVYNGLYHRARGTPRLTLYGGSAGRKPKIHMFEVTSAALWRTASRLLSGTEDTEARAMIRSILALACYRWGCREDPANWDAVY